MRVCEGWKVNVLFKDTFNIFYLRLYGVKNHSGKKVNQLPALHVLLFSISKNI